MTAATRLSETKSSYGKDIVCHVYGVVARAMGTAELCRCVNEKLRTIRVQVCIFRVVVLWNL